MADRHPVTSATPNVDFDTTPGGGGGGATDPTTTRGDMIYRDASGLARRAVGALRRVLSSDGTDPVWTTIASVLDDLSNTRGATLIRGASAWIARAAGSQGQVFKMGAAEPGWSDVAEEGLDASIPTADADHAGALYYGTDTQKLYVCAKTGASSYAWLMLAAGSSAASIRALINALPDLLSSEGDIVIRGAFSTTVITTTAVGRDLMTLLSYSGLRGLVITAGLQEDLRTGTGWSLLTPAGGAIASWKVGPARLNLQHPAAISSCGAEAVAYLVDRDRYDFLICLDVVTGDAASGTDANVQVRVGIDDSNHAAVLMRSDGAVELGIVQAGVYATVSAYAATPIDSSARTGGALFLRVSRSPQGFAVLWNLGFGAGLPQSWKTLVLSVDHDVLDMSNGNYVSLRGQCTGAIAGGYVVDVMLIRSSAQSSGSL